MGAERPRSSLWGSSPHNNDINSGQLASLTVPGVDFPPLASQSPVELLFYSWRKHILTRLDQLQACFEVGEYFKTTESKSFHRTLVFFKLVHTGGTETEREVSNLGIRTTFDGTIIRAVVNYKVMLSPPAPNYKHGHLISKIL